MEIVTKKKDIKIPLNYHLWKMFIYFASDHMLKFNKYLLYDGTVCAGKSFAGNYEVWNDDVTLIFDKNTLEFIEQHIQSDFRYTKTRQQRMENFKSAVITLNKKFFDDDITEERFKQDFVYKAAEHTFADTYYVNQWGIEPKYCDTHFYFADLDRSYYITVNADGVNVSVPRKVTKVREEVINLLKEFYKWK